MMSPRFYAFFAGICAACAALGLDHPETFDLTWVSVFGLAGVFFGLCAWRLP